MREVIVYQLGIELKNVLLSDAKADEILQFILETHDCNIGVTWDNIAWATEEVLGKNFGST